MAVYETLIKLHEELKCLICDNHLSDPVTIHCGHNFCFSCIHEAWKADKAGFPCPVCKEPSERKHVSLNMALSRLAEQLKLLLDSWAEQEKKQRCEEHSEIPNLFCEEDQELLCPLCAHLPAHQDHHMRPVAKAAASHRQRLRALMEPLKKQLAGVQALTLTEEGNFLQHTREVREQRERLASEFQQLTQTLEREQEAAWCRLAKEDERLKEQCNANVKAYSDHISALQGLLGEVMGWRVMDDEMMEKEVSSLQQRRRKLEPPLIQPLRLEQAGYILPPLCLELNAIIEKFRECISLDPQTAHPLLHVSDDKKSVTFVSEMPGEVEIWTGPAVLSILGQESFTSGRHYWEVQVGDKPDWIVGVCSDGPVRKSLRPLRPLRPPPPPPAPRRYWTVELQYGGYLAVGSVVVPLAVKNKPTGIGIYLDYELGQVSFYDSRDRSYLHSFTETFNEVLKPYFCVGRDSAPLIMGAERA